VTKVTFENATIRDVIRKAGRIAPTKGSSFDRAAGIVIVVDADTDQVTVKSTNIEVYYMEIVDAVSIEGPSVTWRIPSSLLDGVCNKLPITSGAMITFDDSTASEILLSTGRMRARIRLIDATYYPRWDPFDPSQLSKVSDFGARLQQVQWAASKSQLPPITGINLNGTHAGATDRFRLAITPCEIPQLVEPITIPATTFTPMMKTLGEVMIGQEEGQILVMPDESTQIRAVIYAEKYPPIGTMFRRNESHAVILKKEYLLDMIDQAMVFGARDRSPLLKIILGQQELAVLIEDQEMGLLGNVMDLAGQADHARHLIGMTPDNLADALRAAPNPDVSIYYILDQPRTPLRIDGGSGYEVLLMPRSLEKSTEDGR
jgi:DNA polymerase III sliding clamp (beta) subunit (PCNA family)